MMLQLMCHPAKHYSRLVMEAVFVVKKRIDENPLSRAGIPELLDETAVGQNLLRNAFKDLVGSTIVHYQLVKRLEQAAQLLVEDRYTIQQVAFICGYRNKQANFSADFKKIYGIAPREWCRIQR
jgi:AraC-like DNA-binding protein